MFTGLVDDVGLIEQVRVTDAGREFRVRCRYTDLVAGESIALDGACLTVRQFGEGWFAVAAVVTTLDRTSIGSWQAGRRVNLERAMRPTDRLGGHIVQGHVDGVGTIASVEKHGDAWIVMVDVPADVAALLVPHGSITVDGISLTVNALPAPQRLGLSIIEYTWRHTALSDRVPGSTVHLESDVIGKFVRQLLQPYVAAALPEQSSPSSPQIMGTVAGLLHSLKS